MKNRRRTARRLVPTKGPRRGRRSGTRWRSMLPARSTWIEVARRSSARRRQVMRRKMPRRVCSAIRRTTLLLSEAIPTQGSPSAATNSSLARDEFQRAPHRIEGEIHFVGLNVERRREPHHLFRIQRPVDDHSVGYGRGNESMRDLRVMKLNSDKQAQCRARRQFPGARKSFSRATISVAKLHCALGKIFAHDRPPDSRDPPRTKADGRRRS